MVPYNHNTPITAPSLPLWVTGSKSDMDTAIVLDQPANAIYTNLDHVSGKVVLRCSKAVDIDNIQVKLEGESRSRLQRPSVQPPDRGKTNVEYHKILYKVSTVFPPADVLDGRGQISSRPVYMTLPPGLHEYPFVFKIPFNNTCSIIQNQVPLVLGLEGARPTHAHVKKTLPPTLAGFPGIAEIRYFVKATVNRHSFFKENPRIFAPFNFFPIEPPRPPLTGAEVFGRQRHTFEALPERTDSARSVVKGLFKKSSSSSSTSSASSIAPYFSVDIRLPEPAILTCNRDIPLRLIVKKLNDTQDTFRLLSLSISLTAFTKVRAHEFFRVIPTSIVIVSKSDLNIPIGNASDPINTETILDDSLWRGHPLPNIVAPSFETCNILRTYQLDVRVGFGYGSGKSSSKTHTIHLPLRLDVQIFSGIAPPAEVLARMANASHNASTLTTSTTTHPTKPPPKFKPTLSTTDLPPEFGANQIPPTPTDDPEHDTFENSTAASAVTDLYGEAPPSYEDAIATDVPPVLGARPQYVPPAAGRDAVLHRDEKGGWVD